MYGDASEINVPVYPPATTESFSMYGQLAKEDTALIQAIEKPEGVIEEFGGLEVTLLRISRAFD